MIDMTNYEKVKRRVIIAFACYVLLPLVLVDIDFKHQLYVFPTTFLAVVLVSFRSLKSPTTFADDEDAIHPLLFPLFSCIEFFVLIIFDKYIGTTRDWSHAFIITTLIFGWGIISVWIIFLHAIRHYLPEKWNDDIIRVLGFAFTRSMIMQLIALILISSFRVLYASPKHQLIKYIYEMAFAVQSADMVTVASFKTGCVSLLVLTLAGSSTSYFMFNYFEILGIGIFLAFLMRFDISNGSTTAYFPISSYGYMIGLSLVSKWSVFSSAICTIGVFTLYFIGKGDNQLLLTFNGLKGIEPITQIREEPVVPSQDIFNGKRICSTTIRKKEVPSRLKENYNRTREWRSYVANYKHLHRMVPN